jgi:hypothetical protein
MLSDHQLIRFRDRRFRYLSPDSSAVVFEALQTRNNVQFASPGTRCGTH